MRPLLLAPDVDLDLERELPSQTEAVASDLGLESVFRAMANDDELINHVVRHLLLASLTDQDVILYRQAILQDCLEHPETIRELYQLADDTLLAERRNPYLALFSRRPTSILWRGVETLKVLEDSLRRLGAFADREAGTFASSGLRRFIGTIQSELDDDYLALVRQELQSLGLRHGMEVSARLGAGNKGADYTLRRPPTRGPGWRGRLPLQEPDAFTFEVAGESDTASLGELRDRGLNLVADALGRATDHVLGFFVLLRQELAFYIGCLNLHQRLGERGVAICFPEPDPQPLRLQVRGLSDLVLLLESGSAVVPNDLDADGRPLVVITGANQGGKSTFLRSLGTAQLLLQAGMFVPAQAFSASLASGIFTHYKREEDKALESGKFDEELRRMSDLVDRARPGALVLSNESFSATNEREGSDIGRDVIEALLDAGVRVVLVTHLFELASSLLRDRGQRARFLRAERADDGSRSYRLREGEPLATSYGRDLYTRIFDVDGPSVAPGPPPG